MNEITVNREALTEMVTIGVEQGVRIAHQKNLIDHLVPVMDEIVKTEEFLKSIRGDFSTDALESAADFVDQSPLRHSLPEVWKMVTLHVHGCLNESYMARNKDGRSDDLYIMESKTSGAVKVGRTSLTAEVRVKQLKTSCPDIKLVKVFKGHGSLEPLVHKELKHVCTGGEWFGVSAEHVENVILAKIECTNSTTQ